MAKHPNQALFTTGLIMIFIGMFLLIASVFGNFIQASVGVETPAGSIKAEGLSPFTVTLITSGFILIVLGSGIIGLAFKVGE